MKKLVIPTDEAETIPMAAWEGLPYLVSSGIVGHEFYLRNDTGGCPLATTCRFTHVLTFTTPTLLQCLRYIHTLKMIKFF